MSPASAIPILPRLDRAEVERFRKEHEFFWADLTVPGEATIEEIVDAFELDEGAARILGSLGKEARAHGIPRLHFDDQHVVFPFWCVKDPEADVGAGEPFEPFEVNVLVHGDYMLTVHREAVDLRDLAGDTMPPSRSERYAVYVVLEAMNRTFFQALLGLQEEMSQLETELFESGAGAGAGTRSPRRRIRDARLRLSELRRVAGPERVLFERVSEEIDQVRDLEKDDRDYFERINQQLDRIVESIDAASQGLSSAVEVQLNETSYRLTILATVFLPLTLITGFFGMNFEWMVQEISSQGDFWLGGIGGLVAALLVIVAFLAWQGVIGRPRRPSTRGRRV